jgi:hypothetical protein
MTLVGSQRHNKGNNCKDSNTETDFLQNYQQDATVSYNLLFLDCSTCFERYFRSSLGASKL